MQSNKDQTDNTTYSLSIVNDLSSVLELLEEINKLKIKILNSKVAYVNQVEAVKDLQNAEMKLITSVHPAKNW